MMGDDTRTLYDVTQLLESADHADERVRRVLELLRKLVPYQQCAMLEARLGHEPEVVLVPDASSEERAVVTRTLVDIFGQLVDPETRARPLPASAEEARLAVPLVGLDEVIGILLVRSSVTEYSEVHLRGLSVIAAKLAAYITIRGAGADLAEVARERDEAAELEHRIKAQAQHLDDLLGEARLASAQLRLTLRKVAPALVREGEGGQPSSPRGWKRRGLLNRP